MADLNTVTSTSAMNNIKNNQVQRPTSLIVSQPSSPTTPAPNTSVNIKTPSPLKHQSPTSIIQIPPSPIQNKIPATSPTSLDASTTSNVPQQTTSL